MQDILELLENNKLFDDIGTDYLTRDEALKLASENVRVLKIKEGEAIIRSDTYGDSMFLLARGELAVYVEKDGGNRKNVAKIKEGNYFGEFSILTHSPRVADVIAVQDCILVIIDGEKLWPLVKACPAIGKNLLLGINQRLDGSHTELFKELMNRKGNLANITKDTEEQCKITVEKLKKAQEKLALSEYMASFGNLASGIVHEVYDPLVAIKSSLANFNKFVEKILVLLEAYDEVDICEDAKKKIDEIKGDMSYDYIVPRIRSLSEKTNASIENVINEVTNINKFTKNEAAPISAENINDAIDITLNILMSTYREKVNTGKIKVNKEYGNIPLVECCISKLSQVFMHILMNAFQAIKDKGNIAIKTFEEGSNVSVLINDTGVGIHEGYFNKIFTPFFTTKNIDKSAGLGLSISMDIIKQHKGSINVESVVGRGSTFKIKIPVKAN